MDRRGVEGSSSEGSVIGRPIEAIYTKRGSVLLDLNSRQQCVTCTGPKKTCPQCEPGTVCLQLAMTCTQCADYYCKKLSDDPAEMRAQEHKSKAGAIVGGVLGGVVLLLFFVALFYYHKVYARRKQRYEDMIGSGVTDEEKTMDKVMGSVGGTEPVDGMFQARSRSSAATVATRASNVLPVAYIPGVTAVGKRFRNRRLFNNGDTRSHITLGSSILGGDDDDFDEDSETGSQVGDRGSVAVQHANNLTTAIRAKPKLVQITEEDEAEDADSSKRADTRPDNSRITSCRDTGPQRKAGVAAALSSTAVPTIAASSAAISTSSNDPFRTDCEDNAAGSHKRKCSIDSGIRSKDSSDDQNEDNDNNDDNDNGSFILDVEVAKPARKLPGAAFK